MSEAEMSNTSPPPRLPPEDFQCTKMVHAIFDRSVGNCYGSFPCTYSRQHGRIYVARKAVLFYSNLFGFERQLCMFLSEVTEFKTYRSTSIWISMMDGEDFIFKSLSDRERVVALVQALLRSMSPRESPTIQLELDHSTSSDLELTLTVPLVEPRTRAQSCPSDINQETPPFELKSIAENEVDSNQVEPKRKTSIGEVSFATSTCTESLLEGWKKEKKAQESKFKERAVDELKLNCSLSDFFDRFLADGALHSVTRYQEQVIGDTQVQATKWILGDDECMTRTISFCHPIDNSYGIGPSSVMATRRQKLQRYGDFGLCMATATYVDGIPFSDAFHVADRWLVEQITSEEIRFTVLHDTVFTKRTIFKRTIQASTKAEIHSWYKGYVAMLMAQVQGQPKIESISPVQLVDKRETVRVFSFTALLPVIAVALLAMIGQNYVLYTQVRQLQVELKAIREQQTITLQLIQDAIAKPDPSEH